MFQFQPFTQAELDADLRLATLVQDKRRLLVLLEQIVEQCATSEARSMLAAVLVNQGAAERQREAAHLAAVQAENVRRGWKPATWREILGEPDYVPHEPTSESDGCCHLWTRHREGWSCSSGWKCPLLDDAPEREQDPG